MTVQFDLGGDCECAECGRWMFADGGALVIELAITRDLPGQAWSYLAALQASNRRADQQRFEDIAERFEHYSIYGELEPKVQLRHLEGDIWEIKTAEDRILFFHTDANGHKRAARVTNCCEKSKSKTQQGKLPVKHIRLAGAIQKVDRSHD